jgi:type VI secretion system protein ImpJ
MGSVAVDDMVRVPEPVQWSEGMALAPQHFQQNDIQWNALLRHQMFQLQPHYWGLLALELDDLALQQGKVVVKGLHAVMPDGLVVQFPAEGKSEILEVDIPDDAAAHAPGGVLIQLAVPTREAGAASPSSSIQRYDSAPGALERDENTGDGQVPVKRLRVRLSLLAGESLPPKYIALRLLRVRRELNGQYVLTTFHPPLLRIGASGFLGEISLQHKVEDLAAALRRKSRELLGATSETAPSFTNNYQRQIVRQLVEALPLFELLARMPEIHPFACYVALAQVVGHVCGLSADPLPPLLKPYCHDDAAPGFLQAIEYVSSVIAKLSAAYAAMPFERPRENLFTCDLSQGVRTDRLVIELKPASAQTQESIGQWLQQAFIGSAAVMPLLRRGRLPRAGNVRPLTTDELKSLGAPSGFFYEIENGEVQDGTRTLPIIRKETELHIEGLPGGAAPAAIVLYVPSRQALLDYDAAHAQANGAAHG